MAFSERHITSSFFPWRNGTESLTQQDSCELVIRAKPNTSFPNQLVDGFVSSGFLTCAFKTAETHKPYRREGRRTQKCHPVLAENQILLRELSLPCTLSPVTAGATCFIIEVT